MFTEYIEEWKRDCRTNSSDSYHIDQDRIIRLHIKPLLGQKELTEINASDISKVLTRSKSIGHSKNTQLYIYVILSKIFSDAIEFHEYKFLNPVKKKHHKPNVPTIKSKFMKPEQSLIVMEYVMGSLFESLIWIQLFTGCRVGEVLLLRWRHIDFDNDFIWVEHTYIRKTGEIQEYTKNGSQVYLPLPPRLKAFLLARKGKPDDLVAPNTLGNMICYYVYRRYLRVLQTKLNLDIRSSHGLRHSATELWAEAGATIEDLRRLLNHNSQQSTLKYVHRTDRRLMALSINVGIPFDSSCIVTENKVINE